MPVRANAAERRIRVDVGAEAVVIVCREPSAQEVERFLRSRVVMKRNRPVNRHHAARVAFLHAIMVDIENAEWVDRHGKARPLTKETAFDEAERAYQSGLMAAAIRDWRDLVPPTWKAAAAMVFEEPDAEEADPDNGERGAGGEEDDEREDANQGPLPGS